MLYMSYCKNGVWHNKEYLHSIDGIVEMENDAAILISQGYKPLVPSVNADELAAEELYATEEQDTFCYVCKWRPIWDKAHPDEKYVEYYAGKNIHVVAVFYEGMKFFRLDSKRVHLFARG